MSISQVAVRLRVAAKSGTLLGNPRWVPDETDALTLARGRRWSLFWHGAIARELDMMLVRFVGWSPVYTLFAHRDGAPLKGTPILLHTRGRLSGQVRTLVLPAFRCQGSWMVCATAAGGPRDPHWVKNIAADPNVVVHLRRRRREAIARILTGDERDRAVAMLADLHPSLPIYERRAARFGRTIPIIAISAT
jgi:deazaflavin-dependent oxidoreductase (nitroreductase family)